MYYQEEFTKEEEAILLNHFTNIDKPVFCLINMPEVVKGALYARYSRSPKSLRRLFLDEFWNEDDKFESLRFTDTETGRYWSSNEPIPICPLVFLPQHLTRPKGSRAQV